jgi:regulatory protein
VQKQKYTVDEALERLQDYCAKEDRSRHQVEKKLFAWKIPTHLHDDIIFELIQDDFLNEERFAKTYARSKMRMNRWGRLKIQQGLRQHRVSDYNTKTALDKLNSTTYRENLEKLLHQKWKLLGSKGTEFERKQKLTRFLLQRGFLSTEFRDLIDDLSGV